MKSNLEIDACYEALENLFYKICKLKGNEKTLSVFNEWKANTYSQLELDSLRDCFKKSVPFLMKGYWYWERSK